MARFLLGLIIVILIIGIIGLVLQNIIGFIGIGIAIWAIYEWSVNRKLGAKSKKPATLLLTGIIVAFLWFGLSSSPTQTELANGDVSGETVKKDEEKSDIEQTQSDEPEVAKTEDKLEEPKQTNADNEERKEESKSETKKDKQSEYPQATVNRVIDGDTIEISMNGEEEDVRLLLIDTPETKGPNKPVEPFGPEATDYAKEVLEGKTVGIQVGTEERDKYDRLLAYAWVGDKTFQEMILEKGLARTAYLYNDLTMLDEFHEAQDVARNQGIGVWSIEGYAHVDHDHGYHYEEPEPTPAPEPAPEPAPKQEYFKNCTELRKVYPNGVPSDHPAYQSKMDRDKDNYACET
ncbi:thermonuclease family protein [Bacillus sp. V3B]|uniref:thermonuclease family protein n=1 Tax=Bacillus sp. V3B TaxID=2804915 RepID=UPI00210D2B6F|nr:thermonuclease family protein [Bacillus sp. V3B]MCQ6276788.1 thermonuclease family protein [Bacillus sp. V3B]